MACAALISLKHTIERLINLINPKISRSAREELKLLEDVLKRLDRSTHSNINRSVINELDAEIREAVWKLEDVLESYALNPSLPPSDSLDEEKVKMEIYLFSVTMKMLEDEFIRELDNPISDEEEEEEEEEDAASSPINVFGGEKSTMVGFLDQFEMLREELLDWRSDLKTVSLFGMAGIGKTHLAKVIYQLPLTVNQFYIRVWATLGPKQDLKNVLVDIVSQIECKPSDLYMEEDKSDLGLRIHQNLCGRNYLIVLNDICTHAWDDLKMWFPAEAHRSRILLTTRLEEVAKYPAKSFLHQMRLFKHEESWNLLCQNVFGEETCPFRLEKPLRKIAERCEGLPLLVLEVAHDLSRAEKTPEYWNEVADNRNAVFSKAYGRISEVLLLSFKYLPQYLKACFLYMGAFPQNYEIPLTKLIHLWTVEDFLEPNHSYQSLEEFAIECFNMLVSQSLAIVCKHNSNYRNKSSKLHSTYWHLCVIEARKNKFMHALDCQADSYEEYMKGQRRLSVRNSVLFGIKEVSSSMMPASTVRSLLCTGEDHLYPVDICSDLRLLKVLDSLAIRFYEFPHEVLKLLQLKYLALTHDGSLPSSISKLEQLQCLILRHHCNTKLLGDTNCLPEEIWNLQELKHLRIKGSNLPNPSNGAQLPNLLTLHVKGHSCTEEVFKSIPKLKKLGIKIELEPRSTEILNCFEHVAILHELESLKCVVVNPRLRSQVVAPPRNFPTGLKKLSLNGMGYSWKNMTAIGLLPNLQVLKLRRHAFRGPEWETKGEEFPKLEFLLLEDIDLEQWIADDDDCFVSLQRLIVHHCYKLEEIPSQIGAILTLEMIEVVDCSPSVVASAKQIQIEEEEEYGNLDLQVPISSSWDL